MRAKPIIKIGDPFTRLVVLSYYGKYKKRGDTWNCLCVCGNETLASSTDLVRGDKRSCGCLRQGNQNGVTHGMTDSPEHRAWLSMQSRCYRTADISYKRYGLRGVTVYDGWRDDFNAFYDHVGPRPSEDHSLDRFPNPNGNYEPTKSAALATFPLKWQGVLCLSRLVIVPGMPKNACTFLLAGSRHRIDSKRWPCLVTYADQWQGHSGGIYRADNWDYIGLTKPERTYTLNGRMIARKAGPKTRTHAEMLALGAECIGSFAKHKFVKIAA